MKSLIKELHSICTEHLFEEKVMLVNQHLIGEQIMEAYSRKGFVSINLKYKTVFDLAMEVLERQSIDTNPMIDDTIGTQISYLILTQLKEKSQLHYFDQMEVTSSFSRSIYKTIRTLRMAGYSSHNMNPTVFLTEEKGQDLLHILADYEDYLHTNQLTDTAELFQIAIQTGHLSEKVLFILQSNLSLTYVEEQFLSKVLPESTKKLPLQQVNGINIPERSRIRSIVWGEPVPYSNLYNIENTKQSVHSSLFTAKTEELEIKNVFQTIKASGSKLDENVIFYTNGEKYITLLYHLAQKLDIPVTFGEGIPILFSRPGRLAAGVLKWMKSNYSVAAFLDLLHEGLLDFGDGAPSNSRITNILRNAKIGWGKERYVIQLNEILEALHVKKCRANDEDHIQYYENQLHQVSWLVNWFKALLKKLPINEEQMIYREALAGMTHILKNQSKTTSAVDVVAKTALLEEISIVLPFANETYSRFHLFDKLEDLLLSLSILHSKPKPGHLHVSAYQNGIYQSRKNIFIIGLDNRKFPGGTSEDPLLLDIERKYLGNNLPFLKESSHDKLYSMLQLLAQHEGAVSASYCNFDVSENRVVSPAYLFLQLYRLKTAKWDADFKEMKQLPSTIVPTEIFDERDYWSKRLLESNSTKLHDDLYQHFANLANGLQAERNRMVAQFTEYDGLVPIDPAIFDPRKNNEKVMTASKLETLATCPYSYFLGEVLKVKPVEEMEFDPYKWLDPATRGSLLHKIFEMFYQELQKETNPKQQNHHENLITQIAKELIDKLKKELPPPNERVYQMEVHDILECSRIFLKEEESHCQTYKPIYFEYTFGAGENAPAEITMPSGKKIHLSGKIDRVDETSKGTYHIIDYKTGSTYSYGMKNTFKGGRQLQHFVYALAIEQHLKLKAGSVEESAYYFPTVKGMGDRFIRKQDADVRTNGLDILERLIDVLANGHFTMTDDENDCKFCEFKTVCRRDFYQEEILEGKQMDKNYQALRRFKGVRAYD